MKRLLCITIFYFMAVSCRGQLPNDSEQKTDTLIIKTKSMFFIPEVTSTFEKIDFQKIKDGHQIELQKKGDLKMYSKIANTYDFKIIDGQKFTQRYLYEVEDKNYEKEFGSTYATETVYFTNSPFEISKSFYSNGNIREKGLRIVNGNVYKGIWYYYDVSGRLTNTIDNDKLFGFSWEQVEKFMEENKIPMILGNVYNGRSSINRWTPLLYPESSEKESTQLASMNLWEITWKGEEWNQYNSITLDGNTGKILKKTTYWVKEGPQHNVPNPIVEDFSK